MADSNGASAQDDLLVGNIVKHLGRLKESSSRVGLWLTSSELKDGVKVTASKNWEKFCQMYLWNWHCVSETCSGFLVPMHNNMQTIGAKRVLS